MASWYQLLFAARKAVEGIIHMTTFTIAFSVVTSTIVFVAVTTIIRQKTFDCCDRWYNCGGDLVQCVVVLACAVKVILKQLKDD